MWWVKENPRHDRGGFQNRDVGKTQFDDNFGPDFGTDYARFSDPPDFKADFELKKSLHDMLADRFQDLVLEIKVRNGFVIISGAVPDEVFRQKIIHEVKSKEGVKEVINQMQIPS